MASKKRRPPADAERYRSYFEYSPDGVFVADSSGNYLEVNEAACRMTGYSEKELLRMSIVDLVAPEDRERGEEHFARLLETGRSSGEVGFRRKDGSRGFMTVDAVVISENHHIGFCRETTARKTAEDALRVAQQRYGLAAGAAKIGVWDWNLETNELFLDPAVKAILGYCDDEIPNDVEKWKAHVHPEDVESVINAAKEHLDGNSPEYVFEHRAFHKDGSIRWILIRGRAVRRDDGSVTRMVGTDMDITERKLAELALQRRDAILDAVSVAARRILLVDSWEDCAKELLEKLGTAAEVSRVYVFRRVLTEDGRSLVSQIHEWVAPGIEPQRDNPLLQGFDYRANGFGRWEDLLSSGQPMVGNVRDFPADEREILSGQEIKAIAVVPLFVGEELWGNIGLDECVSERDWTDGEIEALRAAAGILGACIQRERVEREQVRLERQLRESQKLESLGMLAGGIAHDFNNMLAGVLGNASMALQDLSPGSATRGFVEQIDKSARRAAELVRQLLTYAGRGQLAARPVGLSDFVREMAELLEVSISKRAVLRMDFTEDLPALVGDATEIRQIVMNLIINASEAMEDVSGEIWVRTGSRELGRDDLAEMVLGKTLPEGRYVFVEVSDSGNGMDDETTGKIFDPYFSTKFSGRGLGLAAVLGIVRGHRGALDVRSRADEGTTFRVFFPAVASVVEEAPQPAEVLEGAGGWRGEGTVLVVDDEETVLSTASTMLSRMGYDVLTARNGPQGVEAFRDRSDDIELVLLDVTMPVMSGEETYNRMREIREDVRVIFSSGYSEDSAPDVRDNPRCAFLQKPYRHDQLGRVIGDVIATASRRR